MIKEHELASDQTDKYRAEAAKLNNQIDEMYEAIVGQYKKTLEDAQKKKDTSEKSISKEQSAANTATRNLDKAKARAEEFQNDLDDAARKLSECTKEQKRLKESIKQAETIFKESKVN